MAELLDGIRVLDIGTMTPGKYCTYLLAEMGASVIRVERPPMVATEPPAKTEVTDEDMLLNRGKRSITLDLRSEQGQEILGLLLADTDVVIESHRPGVAERIGLGWDGLHERWPRVVLCSLSGFGQDGPRAADPAFDLNFLAASGMLSALSTAGARPTMPSAFLSDAVSGLTAAMAISAAVSGATSSGHGVHLDIAMLDSIFSALSVSHGQRRDAGPAATDPAALEPSPIYRVYEARDGRHLALAAWRASSCRSLFEELGRSDLEAAVWAGGARAAEVAEFLVNTFLTAPAAAWIERLAPLDIEITMVASPEEAFDDRQLRAREMVANRAADDGETLAQISSPVRLAGEDVSQPSSAPAVGADTAELLASIGIDASAMAALRKEGIV